MQDVDFEVGSPGSSPTKQASVLRQPPRVDGPFQWTAAAGSVSEALSLLRHKEGAMDRSHSRKSHIVISL
jgi:hypothetical protein